MTDNDAAAALEACDAAFDGLIVREGAIAREWRVFRKEGSDVILVVRALRMPRDKDFLPRRQRLVGRPQQPVRLALQLRDLIGNVDAAAIRDMAQLLDLVLEFGNGLLEIQEEFHFRCGRAVIVWHALAYAFALGERGMLGTGLNLVLGKRMDVGNQRFQAGIEQMSVYLRRGNVGVAEHLLHQTEVSAVGEEARKRVSQDVRAYTCRIKSRAHRKFVKHLRKTAAD